MGSGVCRSRLATTWASRNRPGEIYGKTLSVPDGALETWYSLLLGTSPPQELEARDAKRALARALVARFHGEEAASAAEQEFDRVHIGHGAPTDIPSIRWPAGDGAVHLPALLADAFSITTSEARRSLSQGAVRIEGERVSNGTLNVPVEQVAGKVLQLGKRRFARVQVVGPTK